MRKQATFTASCVVEFDSAEKSASDALAEYLAEAENDPASMFDLTDLEDIAPRNPVIGQDVTINPRVGPGESIDTEAGLQPWKAKCVGWTDEKIICWVGIGVYNPEGIRGYDRDIVSWK
jgi:hypothetical protein